MSSLAASSSGFCVKVWTFVVGVFLFIPRLVHNLAVRPDDDNDHGGEHMLVWEFGQVRHLLNGLLSLALPVVAAHTGRSHHYSAGISASAVSFALTRLQDEEPG